jgi:chemotaxis methyl-accepting protein methylase
MPKVLNENALSAPLRTAQESVREMAQMESVGPAGSAVESYPIAMNGAGGFAYKRSGDFTPMMSAYLFQAKRIWNHLPTSLRLTAVGQMVGKHLHHLVCVDADRKQYFATFFLRNRPELELMCRLLRQKGHGSNAKILVLACSKGAEVYSIQWAIRSARSDLKLRIHAVDISEEIVAFAERGIYSLGAPDTLKTSNGGIAPKGDLTQNTNVDQSAPIFERMTNEEIEAMCEVERNQVTIRPWLKEGISWLSGDAGDPGLVKALGPQDIVVANRFLCHMRPANAEECLRNIARLVKPGGYLFVSGIDLDVRTKVARDMKWKPVTEMIREVHDGDSSIRQGWPLSYWGLEPLRDGRPDWQIRYASVFQIGEASLHREG